MVSRIRLHLFRCGIENQCRSHLPAVWLSLLLALFPASSAAQARETEYWNALEKADQRITASQIRWKTGSNSLYQLLVDYRFGPEKQVVYRVRNALPSDTQVRELMTKQERELQQAQQQAQRKRQIYSFLSYGSLIAASIALFIWVRRPAK